MRAGVIVAGGRSERFDDGDKAVADLAGVPLIRRVADRLVDVVDELVVNCRGDQRPAIADALDDYPHEVRFALDPEPDEGPMAGLHVGLRATRAEYAFVTACDMPFIDPDFVEYLFEQAAGHDVAIPVPGEDKYEPLHAVYRTEPMAAAAQAALDRGDRRSVAPVFDLDWVGVGPDEMAARADAATFENVNTREDLVAAAARFEAAEDTA
jgi:molybdopterin-guanine dinucleotide biosynthesis protein A